MFFYKLLDLIFPKKCPFCNIIIKEDYACKKCKRKLEYMCINNTCYEFKNRYFDNLICTYFYDGIIRKKLLEFKFKNKKFLYEGLSERLVFEIRKLRC